MIKGWVRNLFMVLLPVLEFAQGATLCQEFFASSQTEENRDGTDDLIAYLGTLLEERIVGEKDMSSFAEGLKIGRLVNPISEEQGRINSAALLHRKEIQDYLEVTELNQSKILLWTEQILEKMGNTSRSRDDVRAETKDLHHKMTFNPLPPGEFEIGEAGNTARVTLTHAIEMMSTQVTQRQWVELMGENPSVFKGDDNPVENITWWSALTFANKLSEKHGLKPAYDLSRINFEGRAEDGTLHLKKETGFWDYFFGRVLTRHDIYLAEGYRLPTAAEQEYVRRNLGRAVGGFFFGVSDVELEQYAWFHRNSNGKTHPVGELEPLTIDGNDFYDLYGNVDEWGFDNWCSAFLSGTNPSLNISSKSDRVRAFGHYNSAAGQLRSPLRGQASPDSSADYIGFRLVRTLK